MHKGILLLCKNAAFFVDIIIIQREPKDVKQYGAAKQKEQGVIPALNLFISQNTSAVQGVAFPGSERKSSKKGGCCFCHGIQT